MRKFTVNVPRDTSCRHSSLESHVLRKRACVVRWGAVGKVLFEQLAGGLPYFTYRFARGCGGGSRGLLTKVTGLSKLKVLSLSHFTAPGKPCVV